MRKTTIVAAVAAAVASLVIAAEARAQVQPQAEESPGEFRVYEENDFFNPFTEQTDRYYTQGLKVEWLRSSAKSDANFLPGIDHHDWCSLLCGKGAESAPFNTGYAVGQNIYTPADIRIAAPQPFDRPWVGLLYASRIARVRYVEPTLRARREDRIEMSLGVVGPASLAKETQIAWHKLIGAPGPKAGITSCEMSRSCSCVTRPPFAGRARSMAMPTSFRAFAAIWAMR